MRYFLALIVTTSAFCQTPSSTQIGLGVSGGGSGTVDQGGNYTWTGIHNFSGGSFRFPEKTVATLPAAAGVSGMCYRVTDAYTSGTCLVGAGTANSICCSNGVSYVSNTGGASMPSPAGYARALMGTDGTSWAPTWKVEIPSGGAQAITGAASTITADRSYVAVDPNGTYTLGDTSNPVIVDGNDGQMVTLTNVDTTLTLTLGDQAVVANSNLCLGGANVAIGPRASKTLYFSNDLSCWTMASGSASGGTWGSITGTLSSQTDLQTALDAKAAGDHTHTSVPTATNYAKGFWDPLPITSASGVVTIAGQNYTQFWQMPPLHSTIKINTLDLYLNTACTAACWYKFALYSAACTGAPIAQTAATNAFATGAATGMKQIAFTSELTLAPGIYWLAHTADLAAGTGATLWTLQGSGSAGHTYNNVGTVKRQARGDDSTGTGAGLTMPSQCFGTNHIAATVGSPQVRFEQ